MQWSTSHCAIWSERWGCEGTGDESRECARKPQNCIRLIARETGIQKSSFIASSIVIWISSASRKKELRIWLKPIRTNDLFVRSAWSDDTRSTQFHSYDSPMRNNLLLLLRLIVKMIDSTPGRGARRRNTGVARLTPRLSDE